MQLLPDLTPWASEESNYIYGWRIQGDDLRLTTAMANIGEGAMEVRGGNIIAGQDQEVYQRIYNEDGTFTDVLAGTYEYHDGHGHIHFEDFAHFRLRDLTDTGGVGDIVAQGEKVSFCLIDVSTIADDAGARTYASCGQVQGVSPGWADVYSSGLPGQSINIAGVVDGTYWLEVEVDPLNRLIEADETNNITRILVTIDRSDPGPVNADAFEENNSFATASVLAPPEDHVYEDLSIHDEADEDYFRITAAATGEMTIRINFAHANGDVDMILFNSEGVELLRSNSVRDSESVTVDVVEGEQLYAAIFGYNGAVNSYTMFVDQPDRIDDYEPNDSVSTAVALDASEQINTFHDLSIHQGDTDYFSFVATASGQLKVHLDFQHDDGDINGRILNASGEIVVESLRDGTAAMPDHEHLQFEAVEGETYFINVFGADDAVANPHYSIQIEQPQPSVATFEGRTYTVVGSGNSWTEASAIAASMGGTLLRIQSQAENDFIMDTFWDDQAIFLDASDAVVEGLFTYSNGNPLMFSNWRPGEPNDAGGIQDYARIADSEGRWDDGWDGSTAHRSIEGWMSNGTAMIIVETGDDPEPITFGGNTYTVLGTGDSWAEAQALAASQGGRLLRIDSQSENDFVMATFWDDRAIFLDASDAASEGTFTDSNGQELTFQNWLPGEPNDYGGIQDYARIATEDGRWDDGWDGSTAHRTDAGWAGDGEALIIMETGNGPEPITFDGHTYELVGVSDSWSEAQAMASAAGGRLLSVDSQAENDFVMQEFWDDQAIFLDASDEANEGTFVNSLGEAQVFENWRPGEPNDQGGIQDYARIADAEGRWDDGWDGSTAHRGLEGWESDGTAMVIVEYDDLTFV